MQKRNGTGLLQVEHIRGHMRHKYSIFHCGDRKTFEVMTLASLLAEALYQENPDRTV